MAFSTKKKKLPFFMGCAALKNIHENDDFSYNTKECASICFFFLSGLKYAIIYFVCCIC